MKYIVTVLGIFFGDEGIKYYIEKKKSLAEEKKILKDNIIITKYHNKGAMLNFMQKRPNWIIGISSAGMGAVLALIIEHVTSKANFLQKWGSALILGGGFSNLWNRIQKGYVVDYLIINKGKLKNVIFNLSDFAIILGGIMLSIGSIFGRRKK